MKTTAPVIQQHELTGKCNNGCGFCYNPCRCQVTSPLPKEDRRRNLEIAEASTRHGVMAVCLTGGEPLLALDSLLEVMAVYKSAGCYLSINSNGRLAMPSVARKLAEAGLQTALVSLHGVGKLHDQLVDADGAFRETMTGMHNLREAGAHVTPNIVVSAKNVNHLEETADFLASQGFKSITCTPFLPSHGARSHGEFLLTDDHYRTYFRTLKKVGESGVKLDSTLPIPPCALLRFFPEDWQDFLPYHSARVCMAGRSFGVVSPDGLFRACIQAPYLPAYGGSVSEHYTESWRNANRWALKKLIPNECSDCAALAVCGGGCRTSSLWENRGEASGKTMYMGKPLTPAEAEPFLERTTVHADPAPVYRWHSGIRTRNEGWGVVVFNTKNQSFTVLDASASNLKTEGLVCFENARTGRVLRAIGAVVTADAPAENVPTHTYAVRPGHYLLPRLTAGLQTSNTVHFLRADTGERYFF